MHGLKDLYIIARRPLPRPIMDPNRSRIDHILFMDTPELAITLTRPMVLPSPRE